MDIPKVSSCDMGECFFNSDKKCHAPAINIGGSHPTCDTYIVNRRHGGDMELSAMVGACKVIQCKHNMDLCCGASGIAVGHHRRHGDCLTFEER